MTRVSLSTGSHLADDTIGVAIVLVLLCLVLRLWDVIEEYFRTTPEPPPCPTTSTPASRTPLPATPR